MTGLEDKTHDIELLSVSAKDAAESSIATVFIPDESTRIIRKKIVQYATEETKSGAPKHQNLIARINSIRAASIKSIFTDTVASFPTEDKLTWWEVWIRKNRVSVFHSLAEQLGIRISSKRVSFPERDILLAEARASQLQAAMYASDALAEVRLAKDRPSFFLRMGNIEQGAWTEEVAQRIVPPANNSPLVTILDTGIAHGHPLILPVTPSTSLYAYDQAWGVQDSHGHGTAMAGLALYGDLFEILSSTELVELTHSIESVKILPPGAGSNQPDLYGAITSYAVALPEIDAPERRRVFCLAVTSADKEYHGKPSSWSATLDQLCAAEDLHSRLIVCAAGNIRGEISRSTYLSQNDTAEIEDPAQSWNAITAGAYTENTALIDDRFNGWTATAPMGDLCPTSRTSVAWDRQWPLKPDVVFEGGNFASQSDTDSASMVDDLSLITTNRSFNLRLFCRFGETSAASALASKLLAEIYSEYPNLRAETVRGLIIHVAKWTPAMLARFGQRRKSDKALMLRRYGYGVPRIEDALRSARNDFTMIIEDTIQPFKRENSQIKNNEMHLHVLPWPREVLEQYADLTAHLRVTLSYFVQPNPGERGWLRRHQYASHGLRFDVLRATESIDKFRERINKSARDEEDKSPRTPAEDARWELGMMRNRGSVHSDYWNGTAAELAGRGAIAVYPVSGWWKENPALGSWGNVARYSLLVTLSVPDKDVDIYTPTSVQAQAASRAAYEIQIDTE